MTPKSPVKTLLNKCRPPLTKKDQKKQKTTKEVEGNQYSAMFPADESILDSEEEEKDEEGNETKEEEDIVKGRE